MVILVQGLKVQVAAFLIVVQGLANASFRECSLCIQQSGHVYCNAARMPKPCLGVAEQGTCKGSLYSSQGESMLKNDLAKAERNFKFDGRNVTLSVPVGTPFNINVTYVETDQPFDLYYLVDSSISMRAHLQSAASKSERFVKELESLTSLTRVGFGLFIDKSLSPFGARFAFQHRISLTSNSMMFIEGIKKFLTETEVRKKDGHMDDSPEGTLDALVQVLACKKVIGWNENTTKLVIVATDAPYHLAGDGKLAGILWPNDLRCHVNPETKNYDDADNHDYPSINQVARMLKETGVFVLFAVTSPAMPFYDRLMRAFDKHFRNSVKLAASATLEGDELITIVKERYKQITSEVSFQHKFVGVDLPQDGGSIQASYSYKCDDASEELVDQEAVICKGVKPKSSFSFQLTVTLPPEVCTLKGQPYIEIKKSAETRALRVFIEPACTCSCEEETSGKNHSDCSFHGDLICGQCVCDNEHSFDDCRCLKENDRVERCTDATGKVCNNRGECSCGECKCNETRYSGKFCEHDEEEFKWNGKLCSGQGTYTGGKCEGHCFPGFEGKYCNCISGNEGCKMPNSDQVCGHAGDSACVCTTTDVTHTKKHCDCSSNNGEFKGKFCEINTDPEEEKKHERHRLICREAKIVELVENIHKKENNPPGVITSLTVDKIGCVELKWMETSEIDDYGLCSIIDKSTSCILNFYYGYGESRTCLTVLTSESLKTCDPSNIMWILIGVGIGTLVIGFLCLCIYKVVTDIYDEREYKKFQEQNENIQWKSDEQNPFYQPPVTTVENPVYRRNKNRSSYYSGIRQSVNRVSSWVNNAN